MNPEDYRTSLTGAVVFTASALVRNGRSSRGTTAVAAKIKALRLLREYDVSSIFDIINENEGPEIRPLRRIVPLGDASRSLVDNLVNVDGENTLRLLETELTGRLDKLENARQH